MRRLLPITRLLVVAFLAAVGAARADEPFTPGQRAAVVAIMRDALARDPSILRDALVAMQQDDQRRADAATRATILASRDALTDPGDPSAGNPHGDVTVTEFFDTRCPYCKKLEPAMDALLAADHGVRLVYKDLPILGPPSVVGARALLAARKQAPDAYARLRTAVMLGETPQTEAGIVGAAETLGLDGARLRRDMGDPAIMAGLRRNEALAHTLGIEGTPGLVIGDRLYPGTMTTAELAQAVAAARSGG